MYYTIGHEKRYVFALQRRHRVLEEVESDGSDSLDDDRRLMQKFQSQYQYADSPRTSKLMKGVFNRKILQTNENLNETKGELNHTSPLTLNESSIDVDSP